SIAIGRTLDVKRAGMPSISVGIISATGRIWGKALQTDAKISPVNYGGPLVDLRGRVQGILVPASPQGEDVTAGFEWYDSGIGFAIPMEDVMAVLPRLKEGKDLMKGLLGIRMKSGDMYSVAPEIGEVTADSAAFRAGLKPGDRIVKYGIGMPQVPFQGNVSGQAQLLGWLNTQATGTEIKLEIKTKDGKTATLTASLESLPGAAAGQDAAVPDKLPEV